MGLALGTISRVLARNYSVVAQVGIVSHYEVSGASTCKFSVAFAKCFRFCFTRNSE